MDRINNIVKYLQCLSIEKILNNIPKKSKLNKTKINGIVIYKSPEVEAEKFNISRCLYFDKYNEVVIEFTKKLEVNFSHCNLSSFYKNIESAEIKDKIENLRTLISKLENPYMQAFYNSDKNQIQLIKLKYYINVLFHELLHLSSSKKRAELRFTGFAQINKLTNEEIGIYLNEGYTEYLNKKYFSKKEGNIYKHAQLFAEGIEMIVGSKKMEALYFDANLLGLIECLGKYCKKEEAVVLINKIDYFYKQLNNDKETTEIYEEILTMIANIHRTKLKQELNEGKINEDEYRKRNLLYCDEYEDGRMNSLNVEIEEYEEYFLVIDKEKNESHFHSKDKEIEANKENITYNSKINTDEILQFEIPKEALPLDEANKKTK